MSAMSGANEGSTKPGSLLETSSDPRRAMSMVSTEAISPLLEPLGATHISNLRQQSSKHRQSEMNRMVSDRDSICSSPGHSPELTPHSSERQRERDTRPGHDYQDLHGHLVRQIIDWLQEEKQKRLGFSTSKLAQSLGTAAFGTHEIHKSPSPIAADSSEGHTAELALERLERIIADSKARAARLSRRVSTSHRPFLHKKKSSITKRSRRASLGAPSSDTEYVDGDAYIPSVDAVLDNSKTLGYVGGAASKSNELMRTVSSRSVKEDNWIGFKNEIIKLAHTLRLKGWRQVSLNSGADVDVQRLSGALTNAVYVVTPPKNLVEDASSTSGATSAGVKRTPRKVLLRIYGPQADHLIDREAELLTLRRLARKNIGPRLLGTFLNGRFEEFLNARTLTAEDLRKPETYRQIAKRMRELHDGIDLLEHERAKGPFVWQNWDNWVSRCDEVVSWLDKQVFSHQGPIKSEADLWKTRGLVCGAEWAKFRRAVETYRRWLIRQYGGEEKIKAQLVFAHNDTQYGNLLRLVPTGESPLLLPANEHKQLVVIDFEYANANLPGLEFANHFTEWCYNYHSPTHSYACNAAAYPTPKDQQRFISTYVQHNPSTIQPSPEKTLHHSSTSSLSSFMLDSRGAVSQYDTEEAAREEQTKAEVDRLMKETRLWRVSNHALWVAWGIVQAKVPGMDEALEKMRQEKLCNDEAGAQATGPHYKDAEAEKDVTPATPAQDQLHQTHSSATGESTHLPHDHETEDEPEFDYLAYAQQRAMFFWGDLLELGLIKSEDLSEDVLQRVKRVPY